MIPTTCSRSDRYGLTRLARHEPSEKPIPDPKGASDLAAFGLGAAQAAERAELNSWIAANRLGTPHAYESFLEAFPDSTYAEIAFEVLADALEGFATAAGGPADSEAPADDSPGAGEEGGLY